MKNLLFLVQISLLSLSFILGGCSIFSGKANDYSASISVPAKAYLEQAEGFEGEERERYQLLAINQLLADHNLNDAQQLLDQIGDIPLSSAIASQRWILRARLSLLKDNPRLAIKFLHRISNPKALPKHIQIAYYTISMSAHERNNNLSYSTIARMSLTSLIDDVEARQKSQQIIWRDLQTLSSRELAQLLGRSRSVLLKGWLELAMMAKQYANQPEHLVTALSSWKESYPDHVAHSILPGEESLNQVAHFEIPNQIALLLPLHEEFACLGEAVRDGFMTAFYLQSEELPYRPKITVYDTSKSTDIVALYQQAVEEGAQFIVGPLTKSNVEVLARKSRLEVPTLALNYLPDNIPMPRNMVSIGLSKEQSAKQSARQAWQNRASKVLVLVPATQWGERVKQAFLEEWQNLGGIAVGSLSYELGDHLRDEVATLLNVNQSKDRAKKLKLAINKSFKFVPRRRKDINGIFLVADSVQARQIVPLLRFYYAGEVPVFSIPSLYTGIPRSATDQDLNGIFFNDMPWFLRGDEVIRKLKTQIQSLWAENYRKNSRLYGLGVDAYTLSIMFSRQQALPNFAIEGVTGQLFLQSNGRIYRQLLPAQFQSGVPVAK